MSNKAFSKEWCTRRIAVLNAMKDSAYLKTSLGEDNLSAYCNYNINRILGIRAGTIEPDSHEKSLHSDPDIISLTNEIVSIHQGCDTGEAKRKKFSMGKRKAYTFKNAS